MANLVLIVAYVAVGALLALVAHIIMARHTEQQLERNVTDFFAEIGAFDPDGLLPLIHRRRLLLVLIFLIGPLLVALPILRHFKTRGGAK